MLKIKRIFLVLLLLLSLSFVYACSEKEPSIKKEYYLKTDIESIEINVDEQYEIKIDTDIPDSLTWESNEPEIADVDEVYDNNIMLLTITMTTTDALFNALRIPRQIIVDDQ